VHWVFALLTVLTTILFLSFLFFAETSTDREVVLGPEAGAVGGIEQSLLAPWSSGDQTLMLVIVGILFSTVLAYGLVRPLLERLWSQEVGGADPAGPQSLDRAFRATMEGMRSSLGVVVLLTVILAFKNIFEQELGLAVDQLPAAGDLLSSMPAWLLNWGQWLVLVAVAVIVFMLGIVLGTAFGALAFGWLIVGSAFSESLLLGRVGFEWCVIAAAMSNQMSWVSDNAEALSVDGEGGEATGGLTRQTAWVLWFRTRVFRGMAAGPVQLLIAVLGCVASLVWHMSG